MGAGTDMAYHSASKQIILNGTMEVCGISQEHQSSTPVVVVVVFLPSKCRHRCHIIGTF